MMAVTQNNHDVRSFFLGWEYLLFRTSGWWKNNNISWYMEVVTKIFSTLKLLTCTCNPF